MASPVIERNESEIVKMLDQGIPQAQIIREFRARGVNIPRSSLSDYVKGMAEDDAATATQDDEQLAGRFDAALAFQRATTAEIIEQMSGVIERLGDVVQGVQQLKREGDERYTALETLLQSLPKNDAGANAGRTEHRLEEVAGRIDALAARTAGAGLRWIWLKAFLWCSGFWLIVLLAVAIYFTGR